MTHPIDALVARRPELAPCRSAITEAEALLASVFSAGGTLLVCGNGGSAADAEHIVGELMKGFQHPRPLDAAMRDALRSVDAYLGPQLASELQGALPAVALVSQTSLISAIANDRDARAVFAQQVFGYGRPGDALLAISTSGNASNVEAAVVVARAKRMRTIALTGEDGGRIAARCDVSVRVPARDTALVQELHQSVYHTLCAGLEQRFFAEASGDERFEEES